MRVRQLGAVCAVFFAMLAIGACGDDGTDNSPQARAFCAVAEPVKELSGVLETDDPQAIKAAFEAAATALGAVAGDPPKDIAADVATIRAKFTAANDALQKANYQLDQVDRSASQAISDLEDAEFTRAGDNVQAWTTTNCT